MKLIKLKRRKPNRSVGGDIGIYILLILFGIFFVLPLVYSISSAFKPLDEIYLYPPRFFVKNPTFNNFQDLLVVMSSSYVPFTRYVFNTVFITLLGTVGHLIIGSMAAYVLAKYEFPGSKKIFKIIQAAIMFNAYVLQIPTYIIMSKLGWIDTYLALMVPAFALPMGLFLMKQFMEQIPDALIEAAKIDGANGWKTFWRITVPLLKPTIIMTFIMSINGTLQLFDESVNLTKGGPANTTITMSHYVYNTCFINVPNFGYAAAMSFLIFIMVAILAFINLKVGDTRD